MLRKLSGPSWAIIVVVLVLGGYLLASWPRTAEVQTLSALERANIPLVSAAPAAVPHQRCGTGDSFTPRAAEVAGIMADVLALAPTITKHGRTKQPAPPLDRLDAFAFDTSSAKAGARIGRTALIAHSYSQGWSLGNELRESLRKGDVLRLRAGDKIACYRVTSRAAEAAKSTTTYDTPYPELMIVFCSDYDPATRVWQKRTVWYAEPMK